MKDITEEEFYSIGQTDLEVTAERGAEWLDLALKNIFLDDEIKQYDKVARHLNFLDLTFTLMVARDLLRELQV